MENSFLFSAFYCRQEINTSQPFQTYSVVFAVLITVSDAVLLTVFHTVASMVVLPVRYLTSSRTINDSLTSVAMLQLFLGLIGG